MKKNTDEISINILDIFILLLKWKKIVIITTVAFVAIAIAYVLLAEQQFTATAVVVPKEDPLDMVSGVMKNISLSKLQGNLFSPANDIENLYLAILKSKKLEFEVIQKFDLVKVYRLDKGKKVFLEDVTKALEKHIKFGIYDEGTLFIQVTDSSPQRAADMANFIAGTLDEIYKDLSVETARNRRIFLEERLDAVKKDLSLSEDSLALFQIENGLVDIDQQTKMSIEVGALSEARLKAAELDLNIAKKIYLNDDQKIKEMEMNIAEIKNQRDNLTRVRETDLLIPLKIAPKIGVTFFRLKRNLRIQELLFELITQQFEMAKIEESKTTPHVQILDKAFPPQKRSKPKRRNIVILAFLASLFSGFLLVNFVELLSRMKEGNSENYQKLKLILQNFSLVKQ
jgi:tyrosine-protein kinase Etk/Wzc